MFQPEAETFDPKPSDLRRALAREISAKHELADELKAARRVVAQLMVCLIRPESLPTHETRDPAEGFTGRWIASVFPLGIERVVDSEQEAIQAILETSEESAKRLSGAYRQGKETTR